MRDNDDDQWDIDDKWCQYKPTPDGFEYTEKEQTIDVEHEREQAAWCLAQQVIKKAMRK